MKSKQSVNRATLQRQSSLCSQILESKICPLCRGPIEGSLESVEASLLCIWCLTFDFKSERAKRGYFYTVSKREAIHTSECRPEDLHRIHCLKDANGKRRYLRGEVWFLRNLRRKEAAEQMLGMKLGDIQPVVRHFMLGDYLKAQRQCTTTLDDIQKYKSVYERAGGIVRLCDAAHPQAVLDFCRAYPLSGLKEFLEMKEKMCKVFRLEGRRILHALSENERERLKDSPLADVLEEFNAVNSEDVLKSHLRQWFGDASIDAIMVDEAWRTFDWARGSEDRLAVRLRDFWREKTRRTEMLMKALRERELLMPDSCPFCKPFLNGSDDLSLSAIVASVGLSKQLRLLDIEAKDDMWAVAFSIMFHCLETMKMSHFASIRVAKENVQELLLQESEEENEDAD